MSLLDALRNPQIWERFYEYKAQLVCAKADVRALRTFIDERAYLPVCDAIEQGAPFPLPRKAIIAKQSSQKKRTVYSYPEPENTVLKLLTYLLLRRYDNLFDDGLYSFRPGRSAKDAVRKLMHMPGIDDMHSYKVDVSDYFNSVPVDAMIEMLRDVLVDDEPLCRFLSGLLEEPQVLEAGRPVAEKKGIMAGTPQSSFYANLYLRGLDAHFAAVGIAYARYSDDIIVFAPSAEDVRKHAAYIGDYLAKSGLGVNQSKEFFASPNGGWTFLGFRYEAGTVDIAPATASKLKAKMRRKARALQRWRARNGLEGSRAAAAFIRVFNRKLLDAPAGHELSWAGWFFPVITTADTLHAIDVYAQDCIRYLVSGTRTKRRFDVRYEDLKALGYRSLVHEYYESHRSESDSTDQV